MYIYKITNIVNNKIYIGQSKNDVSKRFARHIQDALSERLDTHFARAIRKYGRDNFIIEVIDEAEEQNELNQKENYWIHYYDTLKNGYNETDSIIRCGGNTYLSKTEEEMKIISNKIRESKLGAKNPHSRKVKCFNINTKEELHFDTNKQMQEYFNEDNHNFITRRCNGKTKCLYNKQWLIAYEEDEYIKDYTINKGHAKSKQIDLIDLLDNKQYHFESFAAAERFFNLPLKALSGKAYTKGKHFIARNRFDITILN